MVPMYISFQLVYCFVVWVKAVAWGIAATLGGTSVFSTFTVGACLGGICQSAMTSNRFMEAGMVLGQRVSSLTWKVGVLVVASGCSGLQLGWKDFP